MSARHLFILMAVLLVSCGGAGDETGSDETPPSSTSSPTTSAPIDTTTTSEDEVVTTEEIVQAAITDLAARLDVPDADIEVVEVKDVQWPDGALGCPEEGQVYTQAVVDGTQVLLAVDERVYDYHAGSDGDPFLCPSDEKDGGQEFLPPPGMP